MLKPKMQIAIAGFQHETNTFVPTPTTLSDFEIADSWPPLLLGEAVISGTKGMNLPITGAITSAQSHPDVALVPLLWASAEPGGVVADDAFDHISEMLLKGLAQADQIDALYLDLHGAMVTQSFPDGEGELLRRLRQQLGQDIPIGVSLDLHANVTEAMVSLSDIITIYRTYPHLDMADTGRRCMDCLIRISHDQITAGTMRRPSKSFRQIPFLIPLPAQYTAHDPCLSLYQKVESLSQPDTANAECAMGFTAADIPDCGASVLAYADDQTEAEAITQQLYDMILGNEAHFDGKLMAADDAVTFAMKSRATKPMILADVQDNPGAGGSGDTMGLIRAILDQGAEHALIGLISDADFAAQAHSRGIGAVISADLGGKSGVAGDHPLTAAFRVIALSDGNFTYTGEMYKGGRAEIGPSCLVEVVGRNGVHIVVSSLRTQCLDQAFFTHFGIDLQKPRIIVVKSTVHFRADFEPLGDQVINVVTPGFFGCQLDQLPYQNLRQGLRLGPGGKPFHKG